MSQLEGLDRSGTATTRKRRLVVGGVMVIALALVAFVGVRAWNAYYAPSQGSLSDCTRTQAIIDSARNLPHDQHTVDVWTQQMSQRHQHMDDGYLQATVARYEYYAARITTGTDVPTTKERRDLSEELQSHCAVRKLDIAFPSAP